MPSFVVEFDSNHGPERRLFTLDADRALRPQMIQVLEELRLADRVLAGKAGDEMAVYWNARELDLNQTFDALGVTVERPLVLRMRPPRAATVKAKPTIKWRSILLPPIEGAIGALIAWFISMKLADVAAPFSSANQVDITVTAVMAFMIGLALALGLLIRKDSSVGAALPSVVLAPIAGFVVILGVMMAERTPTVGAFLVGRIVVWAAALAVLSLIVALPQRTLPPSRWLSALGFGALAGVIAAMVQSLPGPSLMLQAFAFIIGGLGVGFAALGYPAWKGSEAAIAAAKS